ncbi:fumarylacetoacetate hydrolase family protein [Streptomyces sp. A3M-1-3]|uniref:2-keto-4-pentenoate hydratase n=1 Tax=Streptomyces sp. A3M-1-3 TaxID=2962044 RepID=UPI0020B6A354|nr:fumarylacetoacetate hydrolase family protein [Streptomyces sp. A3M-1-3]MCP3817504.1 fumarylacetoacetate hydrolase family protein [Streptomyces sp. A3M-1-3]
MNTEAPVEQPPAAPDARGEGGTEGHRDSRWTADEAAGLLAAERARVPVAPLTERRPGLSLEDAYRVQATAVACQIADGARVVGHKVGVTSEAMQQQMGVDEPDSGVLLDDMILPSGSELLMGDLMNPRVEAEIAFRLGRDLQGPDVDVDAARRAVSDVFLALEVIDTRFTANWRIALEDSVADNASCARVVTGAMLPLDPGWDLGAEELVVSVDGTAVAAGEGRAVLGDPVKALIWLARRLSGLGAGLKAGDLVLAGSVHASLPLEAGTEVRVTSATLPAVHLRVG